MAAGVTAELDVHAHPEDGPDPAPAGVGLFQFDLLVKFQIQGVSPFPFKFPIQRDSPWPHIVGYREEEQKDAR